MLEAQGLLYDFIKEEKEAYDAYDPEFYQLLNVNDIISINLAENPKFTEDNTFVIKDINEHLILCAICDLNQTWMAMYFKLLDDFQLSGIAENKLKLYKTKKSTALKFIFTD